jgi:adenylate kinase
MKIVVTGQVGLDKAAFLEQVAAALRAGGAEVDLRHVGRMMYAEAPDVAAGRILDLPLSRLRGLRRSVFKDILAAARQDGPTRLGGARHLMVNTHATFRWRHGLFYAFDHDQMQALDADMYVALVDNIDRVHWRLVRDGQLDHTLKDLMVWREEEILATELLSQIVRGHGCFYIVARGDGEDPQAARALANLMVRPRAKKAYLSFPMSHVRGSPAVSAEIDAFRRRWKASLICFDPGDVEEKPLGEEALEAARDGRRTIEAGPPGARTTLETAQALDILADIDGQIYARDFKLIDQSDLIISLIPTDAAGRPMLSSGVERELQHAHEATKEVFVIWRPRANPSPFITETATRVFASIEEADRHFLQAGYFPAEKAGGLFAQA